MHGAVSTLLSGNPGIGAIVFECTDLPPFSEEVSREFGLPVYDIITLGRWFYSGLIQRLFAIAEYGVAAMHYDWSFGFLLQYSRLIAIGTAYTIGFTILTAASGFVIGCVVSIASLSKARFVSTPLVMLVEVFRCTPVLVQLVWIYYALPVLIGVELSPPWQRSSRLAFMAARSIRKSFAAASSRSIWGNGMLAARWACAASI